MTRMEVLEAPLHRSLVEPMLLGGLPRAVALVLWTLVSALAFGFRQTWVLPLGVVLHLIAAVVTRADPYFFEIVLLAIHLQKRLHP